MNRAFIVTVLLAWGCAEPPVRPMHASDAPQEMPKSKPDLEPGPDALVEPHQIEDGIHFAPGLDSYASIAETQDRLALYGYRHGKLSAEEVWTGRHEIRIFEPQTRYRFRTLTVSRFVHLGFSGTLVSSFANDRLFSIVFYPSSHFHDYERKAAEYQIDLGPWEDGIARLEYLGVVRVQSRRFGGGLGWYDLRLVREVFAAYGPIQTGTCDSTIGSCMVIPRAPTSAKVRRDK